MGMEGCGVISESVHPLILKLINRILESCLDFFLDYLFFADEIVKYFLDDCSIDFEHLNNVLL